MEILVCISSVPDTTAKINFTDNNQSFDKNGVQFVINPHDEYCLNKAIEIQENNGASITILTVGDSATEPVIRKCLAIGANNAIRVNIDPKDSSTVAEEITRIINEGNFDLILTGKESIDYNGSIVPGLVAGLLNYPFINNCIDLEIEGNVIRAWREIDGGKELVETHLPSVVAGQKGIINANSLRIPNMRGIMQARTKPIVVKEAVQSKESKITIIKYDKPKERSGIKLIDKSNVSELLRLLKEEAKVI